MSPIRCSKYPHPTKIPFTKTHVSRFVLKMQEAGKAPATIRTTIGQLKTTLDIGVELGIVPRNVAKGVR